MRAHRSSAWTTLAWRVLIAVVALDAVSAVGGGVAMLLTRGLGMPLAMLHGSPFSSFTVPALILLLVVGGPHAEAAVLLIHGRRSAPLWSAVAGFAMVVWILVEIAVIHGFAAPQAAYVTAGLAELALVLALLGIVPWIPRIELPGTAVQKQE